VPLFRHVPPTWSPASIASSSGLGGATGCIAIVMAGHWFMMVHDGSLWFIMVDYVHCPFLPHKTSFTSLKLKSH
jgi:hypothetical protein